MIANSRRSATTAAMTVQNQKPKRNQPEGFRCVTRNEDGLSDKESTDMGFTASGIMIDLILLFVKLNWIG